MSYSIFIFAVGAKVKKESQRDTQHAKEIKINEEDSHHQK